MLSLGHLHKYYDNHITKYYNLLQYKCLSTYSHSTDIILQEEFHFFSSDLAWEPDYLQY